MRVSYTFREMSILYADIKGFTEYSSNRSAEDVVDMLNYIFLLFDQASVTSDVYKVHTIGDCYVAVNMPCGASGDEWSHDGVVYGMSIIPVLNFAVRLVHAIDECRTMSGADAIDIRIGIHFGEFVGGLIGTKVLRFDVWGSDVMLANMVESSGAAGRINVSENAKHELEKEAPGEFSYVFNTVIDFLSLGKTNNKIDTYFVSSVHCDNWLQYDVGDPAVGTKTQENLGDGGAALNVAQHRMSQVSLW